MTGAAGGGGGEACISGPIESLESLSSSSSCLSESNLTVRNHAIMCNSRLV